VSSCVQCTWCKSWAVDCGARSLAMSGLYSVILAFTRNLSSLNNINNNNISNPDRKND